jgi:tRNA(Ile2) C34 agmatinyltransferase TiaS
MKLCPYCNERVNLHVGKYRCSRCHIWLKRGECLEMEHNLVAVKVDVVSRSAGSIRQIRQINTFPR